MKRKFLLLLSVLLLISSTYMQAFATDSKVSYLGPQDIDGPIDAPKIETPHAILDLGAMTLSDMPPQSLYSVNDGQSWLSCERGGVQSLEAVKSLLRPGGNISVYVPSVSILNTDSDKQIIRMGQSAKPSGFQINHITSPGGTGSISGLNPSAMEFSYDEGTSWSNISSSTVSDLDAGTYFIRIKSGGTNFASEPAIAVININAPPSQKEPTPSSTFDARTMTLSNIPSNGAYSLDNSSWTNASGSVEIRNISAGSNIYIKARGNGSSTVDSDIQTITIGKQSPPAGVTPYPANSSTGLGGLNNVNSGMKFRMQGQASWRGISGNVVSDLPPGNYEIVTIASGNKLDSDSITVTITISQNKTKAPTPNGRLDAPSMAMVNLSVGMSYSFNGGHDWITITDNHCNKVTLSDSDAASALTNGGIRLKMLGNGVTTIDSDIQNVAIAKASPPSNIKTSSSGNGKNGSLLNVNSSMQYAKQNGNWNDISGSSVSGLQNGTYLIRIKASGYTLSSDVIYVAIGNNDSNVKEATPNANFDARIMTLYNIRGVKYSIDGGDNWTCYTDRDSIVLKEDLLSPEKGIKLYRQGNGNTKDSDAQVITLTRAGAPNMITVTNATSKTLGSLHGVNPYMEYKLSSSNTWIDITGDTVPNLQPASYHVRVHGQNTILPSSIVAVLVATGPASPTKQTKQNSGNTPTEPTKKPSEKEQQGQSIEDLPVVDPNDSPINDSDSATEPILIGHDGIKGWDSIIQNITPNKTILIELHGSTLIPGTLLQAAKDANSDIVIGMDNHVQWSISASTITIPCSDIDLSLKDSAVAIPDKVLSTVTDMGTLAKEFILTHEGSFGFSAFLTLPIDSSASGKHANLLYYNPESNEMEYVDSCNIDDSGYASFSMKHASAYVIIVSNKSIQTLDTKEAPKVLHTKKKEVNIPALIIFICAVVLVTIIMINLLIYILGKKKRKNKI